MGLVLRVLILINLVACLTPDVDAIAGQATIYTPNTPSACFGNPAQGNMIASVNRGLFPNNTACGRRYRVRCTGPRSCKDGSVDVVVVDICVTCAQNEFEISQEAFAVIADPSVGRINIDYSQI